MRLSYLQGLGKTVTFELSSGEKYTLKEKTYIDIEVTGTISIFVDGAGEAEFANNDECCCTREYDAPQTYLIRIQGNVETFVPIIAQYFYTGDDNEWDNKNVPFDLLNRLYISFADITENGKNNFELTFPAKEKIITLIKNCRAKNPKAEILITANPSANYIGAASNSVNFAKSVVSFIRTYKLDGFDIDWEENIERTALNTLLKELRKALTKAGNEDKKQYLLTLAVWQYANYGNYDLNILAENVDQINIMSYGTGIKLSTCVDSYKGFPVSKMIGGIETEDGYNQWDGTTDTLGKDGTIEQKCKYALKNSMAGMMEWRLDNDYVDQKTKKPTFKGAMAMHKYMTSNATQPKHNLRHSYTTE